MFSSRGELSILTLKCSRGVMLRIELSTPVILILNSGMAHLGSRFHRKWCGIFRELCEEPVYFLPDAVTARKAPPMQSDQACQFKRNVNRHKIIFPRIFQSINQKRFDIGLHPGEDRIGGDERLPAFERQ